MTRADPIVGNWYRHLDKGQEFEVVALDEDRGLIEIQYFDGAVDELELDSWYEAQVVPTAEPEDWTGPVDDIETDDLGYTSTTEMAAEDWAAPLSEVHRREPREEYEGDWARE